MSTPASTRFRFPGPITVEYADLDDLPALVVVAAAARAEVLGLEPAQRAALLVEQDQVVRVLLQQLERVIPVRDRIDAVAARLQLRPKPADITLQDRLDRGVDRCRDAALELARAACAMPATTPGISSVARARGVGWGCGPVGGNISPGAASAEGATTSSPPVLSGCAMRPACISCATIRPPRSTTRSANALA